MKNISNIQKRKISFYFWLFAAILTSCAMNYGITSKEFIEANKNRDGSSIEKAIIILRSETKAGIRDEYLYIATVYPNFKREFQGLKLDSVAYDVIKITTQTGEEKTFYFDISNFYGKHSFLKNRWEL